MSFVLEIALVVFILQLFVVDTRHVCVGCGAARDEFELYTVVLSSPGITSTPDVTYSF